MKRSGSGAGSCLGLVVMAVVSTGIILISYHLHRRLEADMKVKIGEGANLQDGHRRRPRGAKKVIKKVRFADDVVEPSSNNEEYRRRVWSSSSRSATTISSGTGGVVDAETLSLSLGLPPRKGDALLALPAPTHAMRRRIRRPPEPDDECRQRA
ncbi:uncharacterized protein C2845_PM05G01250 [Panicum miliaceum]|uniref:Uncharacterized protein n=1 Tax=Panicum miliaceum TaxID=4540 RepID=A0A3L6SW55_PANMI|nr:uncharacterized protein C2845_PM05G01250 [Panicum miliaceum]